MGPRERQEGECRRHTQCRTLYMPILSFTSKQRNTASHNMYDKSETVSRSAAPEVSYSST